MCAIPIKSENELANNVRQTAGKPIDDAHRCKEGGRVCETFGLSQRDESWTRRGLFASAVKVRRHTTAQRSTRKTGGKPMLITATSAHSQVRSSLSRSPATG